MRGDFFRKFTHIVDTNKIIRNLTSMILDVHLTSICSASENPKSKILITPIQPHKDFYQFTSDKKSSVV